MKPTKIVVMGVSGCGKSLVGAELGRALDLPFFDADDFHSARNIDKMSNGVPLSDADRLGWLDDLAQLIRREAGLVLACSALKRAYRDRLRAAEPELVFIYLKGDIETIWSRLVQRSDHYFNGRAMLESQFAQLEEPSNLEATAVDIAHPPAAVVADCLKGLGR